MNEDECEGVAMIDSAICASFETLCSKDVSAQRLQELVATYQSEINRRVERLHGICAQTAVTKILTVALECDSQILHEKLLRALLQLCRGGDDRFTEGEDLTLIHSINSCEYFVLSPLYVDTQDGVV